MTHRIVAAVFVVLAAVGGVPARAHATPMQRLAGTRFAMLAQGAVQRVKLDGDVELVAMSPSIDQLVPQGAATLLVRSPLVTSAYVNVPIEVDLDGRFLRMVYVGYRVQRYIHTAVATHDLVGGTLLSASDVAVGRVPFTGRPPNGTSALVGRRILGAVRAGEPVVLEATQTDQIVKTGQSVVLVVRDGGVSIVADVFARSSGGLGDRVLLFNPQTNKMLSGTVIGPDRAELDTGGIE